MSNIILIKHKNKTMKKLKNNGVRHSNCRIDAIGNATFPCMVQIVKTPKVLAHFMNKKYISLDKAKIAIDYYRATLSINKTNVKRGELETVVVVDDA